MQNAPPTLLSEWTAAEKNVRQLIADGKDKTAVERAKDIHKAQHSAASEALLTDAYIARIQSLARQNLTLEAKSLIDLVRERYPAARPRLEELALTATARSGMLDELLRPLNDPALTLERRATIEHVVECEIFNLASIAECAALPPSHALREAASALQRVFACVTSGPVSEEALAAPVSHRNPLAPWKLLARAIASFHAGEDEACRRFLDAIKPESAPARLVPAIRKMLGDQPDAALSGPAAELVLSITGDDASLRRSLEELDRAFASGNHGRVFESIRTAMRVCRTNPNAATDRLRQHISVRCAMIGLDKAKVVAALGDPARHDAYFLRLFACGMESTGEPEDLPVACSIWDDFRSAAVEEKWFSPKGLEVAAIYIHMAAVLRRLPRELVESVDKNQKGADRDLYFLRPQKLYERACALDPHSEAFAQWLSWAKETSEWNAGEVAKAWHKILPGDIQPLLYLMESSEHNGAFHTALEYLSKAERIDSLHTDVRNARLRLLARNAIRQIQQKKTALAEKTVADMAALPQAQQEDRPAVTAALRYLIGAVARNGFEAAKQRFEVERCLGSAAGLMLIASIAGACKQGVHGELGPVKKLAPAELKSLPAATARVVMLLEHLRLPLKIPRAWMAETAKRFPKNHQSLTLGQLRALGKAAISADDLKLAYAVSASGLERGDSSSRPGFLLLRAQALPEYQFGRSAICAAAAAELARQTRDMELVDAAVGYLQDELDTDGPPLTPDQTSEVLRKEMAAARFPQTRGAGPDYGFLTDDALCPCPDCRRARGEFVEYEEENEEDIEDIFDDVEFPPDMPPEIAKMLYEETKKAVMTGESLEQLLARLITGGSMKTGALPKRKKGKRK